MQFTVDIEEIREKGLDLRREIPLAFLAETLKDTVIPDPDEGFQAVEPGSLNIHLSRVGTRVLVKGEVKLKVRSACKRCLTSVVTDVEVPFQLNLVRPKTRTEQEDDELMAEDQVMDEGGKASFNMGEVDTEPFDGHRVQLDPLLREQILLALPMDVLCKAECKGLCAVCGVDLNLKVCGCEQKIADPRWSALKDIKLPN